jgi:hypothetical protein
MVLVKGGSRIEDRETEKIDLSQKGATRVGRRRATPDT